MPLYLIDNLGIAGVTDQAENLPDGYFAHKGPDAPIEDLYWDGTDVILKPEKPSAIAIWNTEALSWEEPEAFVIPSLPLDWDKLIAALDSSPEWERAYTASERTLKANTAFTTLMSALTSIRKVETLQFALAKLREAMSGISGLGDFTTEEIASINQKLAQAGFELRLIPSSL